MGKRTVTDAVVKAQQKQMDLDKRIKILELKEQGLSDLSISKKLWCSWQSVQQMRERMTQKGYTLEVLRKLRKEQNG